MKSKPAKRKNYVGIAVPLATLFAWELTARLGFLPPSLSAAPSAILVNLVSLLFYGAILRHLMFSLLRIFVAVSFAASFGIMSGILLSEIKRLDQYFSPMLQFVAPVPVVVWMPFVVLFFGAGEMYKIVLATVAGFLIIHLHTYQAARSISINYRELARIYETSFSEKVWHVLLPAAAPGIFVGLRLTLAIAWIVIFFVEYGSATQGAEGLGWFIADARALGRVEDEYAGVLLLGTTGYLTDLGVSLLQRHFLRWADYSVTNQSEAM